MSNTLTVMYRLKLHDRTVYFNQIAYNRYLFMVVARWLRECSLQSHLSLVSIRGREWVHYTFNINAIACTAQAELQPCAHAALQWRLLVAHISERLKKWPFRTIFGPWEEEGAEIWERKVSKDARFREEENEPIGETIGAEMAKRTRDIQTDRKTDKHCVHL